MEDPSLEKSGNKLTEIVCSYSAILQDQLNAYRDKSLFVFPPGFSELLVVETYELEKFTEMVESRVGTANGNMLCYYKSILMPIEVYDREQGYVWDFVEADLVNEVIRGPERRISLFMRFFKDYLFSIKKRRRSGATRPNFGNQYSTLNVSGSSAKRDGGCEDNLDLWTIEKRKKDEKEYLYNTA